MFDKIFGPKEPVLTHENFDIRSDIDRCLNHTVTFAKRNSAGDSGRINTVLKELGIPASIVHATYGIRYLYYIKPLQFMDYDKLLKPKSQAAFGAAFGDKSVTVTWDGQYIVLDVPGASDCIVRASDVIRNDTYFDSPSLMVGVGLKGDLTPVLLDLSKAPHVLIGGETGSGKSILMHDMIVSLLLNHSTEDVQLYLVDPKRVEFAKYGKLRNVTLVNDAEQAVEMLRNLCDEMDNRYNILSRSGCRDIESYNESHTPKMSRKVVFIDELSDLMSNGLKKHTEQCIVRIAQLARACGIHLVIATQRPDRTVVTGLIKDNIPTRICLSVSSGVNSRIILDRMGGEKLNGKGDLLYLGNGMREPVRCQAGVITEDEITYVVNCCSQRKPVNI